jgi:thiamine-monophosphate kinase
MTLSDLGEFGLIERIRARFPAPQRAVGIGDDCAVLPQRDGQESLVSTDMLIEGTHFLRDDITPYQLGWKSAAVNLSDIAAMGGNPTGTLLSLALPADLTVEWIDAFLDGYAAVSAGVPLLGGDTTASPDRICINVTVLGESPSGRGRLRSNAMEGDLICVTGPLGDSAAGLKAILEGVERDADVQALIDRHYLPLPRVAEGLRLAATPGVHAMMDISDGIGSDLKHILEASGPLQGKPSGHHPESPLLGATIDVPSLPLSPELQRVCARLGWDAAALAIGGGEDYELLFTCTPEAERSLDVPHTVIGVIRDLPGIEWRGAEGPVAGFDHFRKP